MKQRGKKKKLHNFKRKKYQIINKRKERDSNPRYKNSYNGLAIRRFSPLSHLSPIQKTKKNYYAYDTSHKQKEQKVGLEKKPSLYLI